jgi:Cof subfamily protein (haloacid dehalogenase superfamily)
VYTGDDWLVTEPEAPHVAREARTVQFDPTVTDDFADALGQAVKIVGVSDDHAAVERCETAVRSAFGDRAAASRSQPYYLDVTHRDANKGAVVEHLSRVLGIPEAEIVTIGDGPNDMLMFERSGFSVAMGNASDAVKKAASAVTASNREEGFAKAIETLVLGAHPLQPPPS